MSLVSMNCPSYRERESEVRWERARCDGWVVRRVVRRVRRGVCDEVERVG